jgi:hypothetical protein
MNVLVCFFSLDLTSFRADTVISILSVGSGNTLLFNLNLVLNSKLILKTDLLLHTQPTLRSVVPAFHQIQLIFLSLNGQRPVNSRYSR